MKKGEKVLRLAVWRQSRCLEIGGVNLPQYKDELSLKK
jgi:hypothetical protein